MKYGKNVAGLLACCFAMLTAFAPNARADLYIMDFAGHRAAGHAQHGVGFLEYDGVVVGSGALLYNDEDEAMVGFTGHQLAGKVLDASRISIGFGTNYFTDRGEIKFGSQLFLPPNFSQNAGDDGDYLLMKINSGVQTTTALEFYEGTISVGMLSTKTGYGYNQQVNDSIITISGDRMQSENYISGFSAARPNYIQTVLFEPGFPLYNPFGGGGTPNDSGGANLIDGKFAAFTDLATPNYNGFFHGTEYLVPDFAGFIRPTISANTMTSVPEPSSFIYVTATGIAALLRRRKRGPSGFIVGRDRVRRSRNRSLS